MFFNYLFKFLVFWICVANIQNSETVTYTKQMQNKFNY